MRKPKRLAALCAAFFMAVCLCSTVVHAEETPAGSAGKLCPGWGRFAVRHRNGERGVYR